VLKAGFGEFEGKWGTGDGKVVGHLKGIYGKNLKGEGVLFGKYIGLAGKFVGLIKGHYEKGFFKARWFDKSGLQGDMAGIYAEGHFLGLWNAYCPLCKVECLPGFVPAPEVGCMCVPAKLPPCNVGQCPQGMSCDICPPACPPGVQCPAACGAPVCVPLPPPPKPPAQDPGASPVDPSSAGEGIK
jgi:hypothetical protein